MRVAAILWDGFNKIQGELVINHKKVSFQLLDFGDTDLEFEVLLTEIKEVTQYSIFGLKENGIRILSKSGRSNVFVVESPREIKQIIQSRMKKLDE